VRRRATEHRADAEHGDHRGETRSTHAELALGQQDLGDVHHPGGEHDRAGADDEQP
jgi:hypothetical protein